MIRILFVCHGNICRSPMAEYYMKYLVQQEGRAKEVYIASAATSREEIGNDIYWGTKEILREQGIPFTRRKAVQLTPHDYQTYDYIITFDAENKREVARITGPDTAQKVWPLLSFAGLTRDVADPWYTGNFTQTYADVQAGCQGLWRYLKSTPFLFPKTGI